VSENAKKLDAMRHSLAHITASAVKNIWPHAKFGVGPVVENGFYYDIDLGDETISEEDFPHIEAEMKKIINENQIFEKSEKKIGEAIEWAKESKQPYKQELLNDLMREGTTLARELDASMMGLPAGIAGVSPTKVEVGSVTFYTNGDFVDLCRGPHVESTGKVGAFKLMRVAGAYWRGKEGNPQMQRLYGVAFDTKEELAHHLEMIEQAKKRDHRKLGKELDLFTMSDLVGPGLPLFTPRGTVLRNELIRFSEELQREGGYEAVWAPHMTRVELYKVSGHYDKYPERFDVSSIESDDEFMLKPMNCPHVTQIYASRPRSYRDLPLRYMETTTMYRDEKSGELHGLSRVRALTQDDSHAFVRNDQIEEEMLSIMEMVKRFYGVLDLDLHLRLSFRDDSDNYLGDKKVWDVAQAALESVAKKVKLSYVVEEGEAAFYGPKIDIMIRDALGREWQCATVQADFVQPERFLLEYTDDEGKKRRPVMIHKAILGSIERFLSVYIEHTAGKFPIWLAPEQIRIASVNQEDETLAFVAKIADIAKDLGLRAVVDNDNESVGKKIRNAELYKVPYVLIVGPKEVESGKVVPRVRTDLEITESHKPMSVENFLKTVAHESKSRVSRTSL
jgi:threonyl-tRNA synthetase